MCDAAELCRKFGSRNKRESAELRQCQVTTGWCSVCPVLFLLQGRACVLLAAVWRSCVKPLPGDSLCLGSAQAWNGPAGSPGRTRCPEVSEGSVLSCELCWVSFQSCCFVLAPTSASSCSTSNKPAVPECSSCPARPCPWCSLTPRIAPRVSLGPLGLPTLGCAQGIQVPVSRGKSGDPSPGFER